MFFKDYDELKLDPDRDDVYDLAHKLLPFIIKTSYADLAKAKEQHDRKYGHTADEEDAYLYTDFNEDGLVQEVESFITSLTRRFAELSHNDIKDAIKAEAAKFPIPLEVK